MSTPVYTYNLKLMDDVCLLHISFWDASLTFKSTKQIKLSNQVINSAIRFSLDKFKPLRFHIFEVKGQMLHRKISVHNIEIQYTS